MNKIFRKGADVRVVTSVDQAVRARYDGFHEVTDDDLIDAPADETDASQAADLADAPSASGDAPAGDQPDDKAKQPRTSRTQPA